MNEPTQTHEAPPAVGLGSSDLFGELEYIAGSPAKEYGGFHPRVVATATAALTEIKKLRVQNKSMRARLQAIAAQIEDSEYYGRISPRGAPKMLYEIADSCHNTLETCDGIARRASPNAKAQTRAEDQL